MGNVPSSYGRAYKAKKERSTDETREAEMESRRAETGSAEAQVDQYGDARKVQKAAQSREKRETAAAKRQTGGGTTSERKRNGRVT
jgi:hypothetical protein